MKKPNLSVTVIFVVLTLLVTACSGPKAPKKVVVIQQPAPQQGQPPQGGGQISNPASDNCLQKGGTLSIVKRGDGGEYGVCTFQPNMECEEWALFRGDCPVGGISTAGYASPAAIYCVIAGGVYTATGLNGTPQEDGTCAFKNNKSCNVWDYYNGACSSEQ